MMRMHALMESVLASLQEFIHSIDTDLSRPQKNFLRDGLIGLLRAGRPVVCRMARKLPDQPGFLLYRLQTGVTEAINASMYAGRILL